MEGKRRNSNIRKYFLLPNLNISATVLHNLRPSASHATSGRVFFDGSI
jgi:hypothetical protein